MPVLRAADRPWFSWWMTRTRLSLADPDADVLFGEFVAELAAAVGGAVVHQNDLEGGVEGLALVQNALDAFFQIGFGVIDRYNDTDRDMFHGDTSFSVPQFL